MDRTVSTGSKWSGKCIHHAFNEGMCVTVTAASDCFTPEPTNSIPNPKLTLGPQPLHSNYSNYCCQIRLKTSLQKKLEIDFTFLSLKEAGLQSVHLLPHKTWNLELLNLAVWAIVPDYKYGWLTLPQPKTGHCPQSLTFFHTCSICSHAVWLSFMKFE